MGNEKTDVMIVVEVHFANIISENLIVKRVAEVNYVYIKKKGSL